MRKIKALGIGLLEMLLVLVVIAAILLMAVRYFGQASESVKVDKAVNILRDVTKGSFEWLKGHSDLGKIHHLSDLKGYVTSNCSGSADPCIEGPWGEMIEVRGHKSTGQLHIRIHNVPYSACMNIKAIMSREGMVTPKGQDCVKPSGEYVGYYPDVSS